MWLNHKITALMIAWKNIKLLRQLMNVKLLSEKKQME